jgi:hypothetical protein
MNDGWSKVASEGLQIAAEYGPPRKLVGTRFDALENPFEVALLMWGWGYIPEHTCDHDLSTMRLYTCVVDAPQNLLHRVRGQVQINDRER